MRVKKQNIKLLFHALLLFGASILHAEMVRIMPLGDSLTYDTRSSDLKNPRPTNIRTGYRSHLWYMLKNAKYRVDFVGSLVAGEAKKPSFDADNEGHTGWTSYEIAEKVYEYMRNSKPDMVLLHIGSNDFAISVKGVESILDEIDIYEQQERKDVRVLVATLIDRQRHDSKITTFNKNLKALVEKRWKKGDRLSLVDMHEEVNLRVNDYADNTHPNDKGYEKMAKVWYKAINTVYKPYATPKPSANPSPKPSVKPSPKPSVNPSPRPTTTASTINSTKTSDGDALNGLSMILMLLCTGVIGLRYIREEELYQAIRKPK